LEIPEAGVIRLRGQTLYQDGRIIAKRLPDVRKRIGMVFQHLHLWPHKTVLGNIIEAPTVTGKLSRAEATERARALLAEVRLLDKTGSYPASLSGGEQQRVAICRTLIMEPEVILLDEITSALDPELVGDVLEVIAGVAERGHTMVVVTHEIVFARDVADRILFLDRGQFVEEGPPERILTEPRHPRTREFLARVLYSKQMRAHL
jgi:polar amino acid transport system ATP-binding protein